MDINILIFIPFRKEKVNERLPPPRIRGLGHNYGPPEAKIPVYVMFLPSHDYWIIWSKLEGGAGTSIHALSLS